MALIKQVEVNGIQVEYWAVSLFVFNKQRNVTEVHLLPYVNKATREQSVFYVIPFPRVYSLPGMLTYDEAYIAIKQFPEWEGAIDDLN